MDAPLVAGGMRRVAHIARGRSPRLDMKRLVLAGMIALFAASPAIAQNAAAGAAQVEQAEWAALLDRASALFRTEFRKPLDQRDYQGVLALAEQAERSAIRQSGLGSDEHLKTLRARAQYLGLSGAYDKQLQVSKTLLKLKTAKMDKGSLPYANALIQSTSTLTYYNDEHKIIGAQTLQQARAVLTSLGPIDRDELADAWFIYASKMDSFNGERKDKIDILNKVGNFRKSENPISVDDYISTYSMLGSEYASLESPLTNYSAMVSFRNALTAAENDPRPEKKSLGSAQFYYGDHLLKIGQVVEAERYLKRAVDTLTRPGSDAYPQFILYARQRLEEATAAKAESLAKAETVRRVAVESAATDATQAGQIVATPALAKMLESLRAAGVSLDKERPAK